ncbi:MAG: Translation elongation factor LepA [Candidatus Ozemobacter sibiricus]|uniref:Elongation factor 4 n=1 Tax=Candidatus Ozemobacter sibiricus TaxID=2268124 RepID=A0A367ZUJ5_9BACT|nr:MAG: Translation elongation factor LepA [Candidatus Ozemobacter sibiricus]
MSLDFIRNFCIIAHIDHGKSTLADRLLEFTSTVSKREMRDQLLDSMDLERERGITIKAQAVRMFYHSPNGQEYIFNLIDTPGHVDFSYEVSRSIAACEGAILVVDATQGVEAQTMANVTMALAQNLEIIPVINKIDLPSADPDRVKQEIENLIGLDCSNAILVSAKEGTGVPALLEAIAQRIPPPKGDVKAPLRALVFDARYDSYKGVVVYCRFYDGTLKVGDRIRFLSTQASFEVIETGVFTPKPVMQSVLSAGGVGYFCATIKEMGHVRIGDTLVHESHPNVEPIPGFKEAKQMVFCGLYPVEASDFDELRNALEKLSLNDASFSFIPENSLALGFGFRCGFLGLLHMEIIQERLEREFNLDLVTTSPNVVYQIVKTNGEIFELDSPAKMPPPTQIAEIREPFVHASMFMPKEFIGAIMDLCTERRGVMKHMEFISENRVSLSFDLPLSEIIVDFYDKLKSRTRGYASMDYEHIGYRAADIDKVDILVNGEPVDALSFLCHHDRAVQRGRSVLEKLRKLIPRHQFQIPLQAAIGAKIIARENISGYRKDVLAKCYGGDITRKRKLLEKQKEGKKRMKMVGRVEIPQEAFMAVLKPDD